MGTSASPPTASPAASAGVAGLCWPANADHRRRLRGRRRPLPGHRRPQAHRRAPATGPGHGRSRRLGDERSRSIAAGPVDANEPTGKHARTRLAVGGNATALWLLAGRTGTALGPKPQLGVTPIGAGRVTAGSHSATSARGSDPRATGNEISRANGASQRRGLRTNGGRFRQAPLRQSPSRAALLGLARRLARGARTHPHRAGTVFENAAPTAIHKPGRVGPGARTGDGRCHSASRQPAAGRSVAGDEWSAAGTSATPHRKRAGRTGADGGANRKGTRSDTC